MSDRNESSAGAMIGVGLCDLLLVLFIGLKLGGVIDWSWWWVTAPFWGQFVIGFVILVIAFIIITIGKVVTKIKQKKGKKN